MPGLRLGKCHFAALWRLPAVDRCDKYQEWAGPGKDEAMIARMIYHVPVFGWMLKEAVSGSTTAKVLFIINLLLVWLLAILAFGYPAIIIPALTAVPLMFVVLILITKG
ncbi:hypothetical protein D3C72_2064110 [compost metagenome]